MHDLKEHCDFVTNSHDREGWLLARRKGIGASDSPGILGVSPWSSGIAVFAEKVDPDPPVETNEERLILGLAMEPVILQRYQDTTSRPAWSSGAMVRSKQWPFMTATLDGTTVINGEPAGLEIKNTQDRAGWSNGVPRHVWVQCQHQMAVTGLQKIAVAVLLSGCEFKTSDVLRDEEFIQEALVPACEHFWGLVEKGGPPPQVDGSEASRVALKRLYPNDSGENVMLTDAIWVERADRREELKVRMKADADELREIENHIKSAIGDGDATFATLTNGAEFSWKADKNGARTLRYKGPR